MKLYKVVFINFLIFNLLISFNFKLISQNKNIDSLKNCIKIDKQDTNYAIHLNKLGREFLNIGLFDSTIFYSNKSLNFCQRNINNTKSDVNVRFKKSFADAYNNVGIVCAQQANFNKALENWQNALKIDEEIGNKYGIAARNGNIGNIYWTLKDFKKALKYFFKALKLSEEIKNESLTAKWLGNIGNVYRDEGNLLKSQSNKWDSLNNLGIKYYLSSLVIYEKLNEKAGIAKMKGNLGNAYMDMASNNLIDKYKVDSINKLAEENILFSLNLNREIGSTFDEAIQLGNLGYLYTSINKIDLAEKNYLKAIEIFKAIDAKDYLKLNELNISNLYYSLKKYKLALDHYVIFKSLSDSIYNSEKDKELVQKEMNFEFEKKEALLKAEQSKKDELAKAEKRKQQIIIWAVVFGLIIVLIFVGFILRSLKLTKNQKKIIESQKHIVEEKQKEIIDSINYAKRLQNAILPSMSIWNNSLPESFVLYQPKDIVAGDFYWLEKKEDLLLFAAADCTGHGVPGAMVSVVCSNSLNRVVNEFSITEPGIILDKTKELVVEHFTKGGEDVKDGMDISICALNVNNNIYTLKWAGANNPLWIIRNGEIIEYKPNKQPIGKTDIVVPFVTHTIELQKNDCFYIFSDGFQDQFGGVNGKKFKVSKMKEILLSIQQNNMNQQKQILINSFNDWKGNLEQVDDICVIGVKI